MAVSKKKAPAKRTAPKGAPKGKKAAPARKARKAAKPKATASRGASPETVAFAKKVVALRDGKNLAWKDVAAKLGVSYDHNGSSKLRRAYTLGGGATVGARSAK